MRVPSYTTTAVPPPITNNFSDYMQRAENIKYIDTGIQAAQDLQIQINLLNKRVEALEELLLEFGIKKVFDKAGDEMNE